MKLETSAKMNVPKLLAPLNARKSVQVSYGASKECEFLIIFSKNSLITKLTFTEL